MKKTARIICANDNEFWTTQKLFWQWVREGLIDVTGQAPLTGRFTGQREKLLINIRNSVMHGRHVEYDHYRPISRDSFSVKRESNPPRIGEYLFRIFLSEKEREHVIGDLIEEHFEIRSKAGTTKAKSWFYIQVLSSIIPLAWRLIMRWKLFDPLLDQIRKLIR